jgi:alkylmercury lyase-like protein
MAPTAARARGRDRLALATEMDEPELDRDVRVAIARAIHERGAIPRVADVASDLGVEAALIDAAFARMAERHVFTASRGSREIYAYHPFCAEPTDFLVRADGREWWAICGWDALGIAPALGTTGTVDTRCGDCREPIHIDVGLAGHATTSSGAVLHVGVPAREFWNDIYFT